MQDLHLASPKLFDHLSTPGARQWWQEAKPRGRFRPNTVRTIEMMQQDGKAPIGPHLK
ncbi:MAG: hypothetical protein AAGH70_11870 [Pseudomonadota bacterium]